MSPRETNDSPCSDAAFTLVEVMVVLAIMAVLMGIGGFAWASAKSRAADSKTTAHMQQLSVAIVRARDERRAPLAGIVTTSSHAACGAAPAQKVASLSGACLTAWQQSVVALTPWLQTEAAARDLLTDGRGRPIVIRFGEAKCAGQDTLLASDKDGKWTTAAPQLPIGTSRYSC